MAWGDLAVKVGEEVGIVRTGRWGGFLLSRFGTVTKVNGHGHIFVQAEDREYRFTRRGDAYKDDYGPRLMQASQLRSALAMEEQRKERNRLARDMEQTLKEGWTYSGTFHTSEERIRKLKEILAEMEKLVDH
jgi:hypothetical protein